MKFAFVSQEKVAFPIAPNVLQRDFTTTAPDQAWVTGISADTVF